MAIIRTAKELPKRKDYDLYQTPPNLVRETLLQVLPSNSSFDFVLDAGAGDGVWGKVYRELDSYSKLDGVELREVTKPEGYDGWHVGDFLQYDPIIYKYDLVMGNPPFKHAEEFIRHGLDLLEDDGYLVYLLRLSMLESKTRGRGLWRETPLMSVHVSMHRIKFYGTGTDDTAYAIYTWKKDYVGVPYLYWLDWENR